MSGAWVLLLSHQAWCPPLRPQTPASRAEAQPRAMELDVAAGERGPSRILPIVETLLRAKPFPATCPYDEATDAAFAQRQTPWVLAPQRLAASEDPSTRRFYSQQNYLMRSWAGCGFSRSFLRQHAERLKLQRSPFGLDE